MVSNTMDFLSNRTQTEIILFCVYIVVMLSAFLFIWIPYMRRINLKIWRTKGMLNMIPMEVINKHESLKNAFISGDILSAVK
jgi:ABC-type bacteriocin/lantibiotic exporter with double-glycine peptidase domain